MDIFKPYLVQRGVIVKNPKHNQRISENIEWDYMGSAEFEFGALPKSLRRIEAEMKLYHIVQIKEITNNNKPLILWSKFPFEQLPTYVEHLIQMRKGNLRMKESSYFNENLSERFPRLANRVDFWWDLDNDTMFSFRPDIMKVLPDSLRVSFDYMNSL